MSEQLEKFFATSKPLFYKKGDVVLRVGETGTGAYYLKKGYIKDSSVSADGREFTLFIFQPNDIFSYNWIFIQTPNEHSFRAMTDCIVYEKSREEMMLFLEKNPEMLLMITRKVARRLKGLMQRMENMVFDNSFKKVGSMFCILGERFGKKTKKGIVIQIPLTQQDVANLIGLSRETTSIETKRIIDMSILARSSGLYVIKEPEELQRISFFIR